MKLAQKCRRRFIVLNPGDEQPMINEILANIPAITGDLEPQQVAYVYQSLGLIISAQSDVAFRERLVANLMALPNQSVFHFTSHNYFLFVYIFF